MAISLLLNYWLIITLLVLFSIKAIFTKWNDRHLPIEAIKMRRKLNRIKIKKINIPTLAEQNKTPMHLAKFRDGAEELNVKSEYKIEKETNSKIFYILLYILDHTKIPLDYKLRFTSNEGENNNFQDEDVKSDIENVKDTSKMVNIFILCSLFMYV